MRTLLVPLTLLLAGCAAPPTEPPGEDFESPAILAVSSAFPHLGAIPRDHTCDGANVSPPLSVTGLPENASTLALVAYDPDAPFPEAPLRNITHWIAWNAPVVNGSVMVGEGSVPPGTVEGPRDATSRGYGGPCPPVGSNPHRYFFVVHAVAGSLNLGPETNRSTLEGALSDVSLGSATLVGTYARAIPPAAGGPIPRASSGT